MDIPREMPLPNHDVPGSDGQSDPTTTNNNNQEEVSDLVFEIDGKSSSTSRLASGEAADHQAPQVILTASIEEMYENLINEIESDVNALVKLPKSLKRFLRAPTPATSTTNITTPETAKPEPPSLIPPLPAALKTKTPGLLKPKGFRVEKPTSKKRVKKSDRVVRAIQAQAEALLTDPNSDSDETTSPTFERRSEWEAVQRSSRLMNSESIQKRPRLVFWTDGSEHHATFSSAVTFKRLHESHQPWVDCAYGLFGACKTYHTELFAIAMALRIACVETQLYVHAPVSDVSDPCPQNREASGGEEMLPTVYILTDWAEGLGEVQRYIEGSSAKNEIAAKILQIIQQALDSLVSMGVLIRLCWVPGHVGLEGNMRADRIAKAARKCLYVDSPRPRDHNESFEAYLISPGKNIPIVGGCSPDGSYESSDWDNFDKLFNPTSNESGSVPDDSSFDFEAWKRIDKIVDEMTLPHNSSELQSVMEEGNDEICVNETSFYPAKLRHGSLGVDFVALYLKPAKLQRYLHDTENKPAWALVTGATSGIGKNFVCELAERGFNVVVHGRNREKCAKLVDGLRKSFPAREFRILIADAERVACGNCNQKDAATRGEKCVDFDAILSSLEDLNLTVLINNAGGVPQNTIFETLDYTPEQQITSTVCLNLSFPMQLMSRLIPLLKRNGPALVMNIGSLSDLGIPYLAPYASSKVSLMSLTTIVAREMRIGKHDVEILGVRVGSVTDVSHTSAAASLVMPDAKTMARAALSRVGCGRSNVIGYLPHALQANSLGWLPGWVAEMVIEKVAVAQKDEERWQK
ncbi:short chain dehydrogenase [Apiospora rasikravindrae]|uniref:Short chain dehydrogenase n=1 Tax=Apiospora rasikravindrae TaxID=990691 RepID=A0ABR1SJV5_9PEZI